MANNKVPPPYLPFDWGEDAAGASAIQALAEGKATPEQQQRALDTIISGICRYYDLSYRPGSDRDTAFAEGMRFVGAQLVKLTKINYSIVMRKSRENSQQKQS